MESSTRNGTGAYNFSPEYAFEYEYKCLAEVDKVRTFYNESVLDVEIPRICSDIYPDGTRIDIL